MPKQHFYVTICPGLYYYCPPVRASFDLPDWVEPDKIDWAKIVVDVDPKNPSPIPIPILIPGVFAIPWQGCLESLNSITLNGAALKGTGDRCDVITADVSPTTLLKKKGNILSIDVVASPFCNVGESQGFWRAYLEGEAYYEAPSPPQPWPMPSPTYPAGAPTGTPPPEEEECKVFGISLGKMPKEQCNQMQSMFMLMFLGLGFVLVISLLRR